MEKKALGRGLDALLPATKPVAMPDASEVQHLPVDAIVLAGTDLSLIFDETNTDFSHVDCAKIHIQAIIRNLN